VQGSYSRSNYIVGVASILFGVLGSVGPIVFLTDSGSPYRQGAVELTPAIIAIIIHICLTAGGAALLLGRRPKLFCYLLLIELFYAIVLVLVLSVAPLVGPVNGVELRWWADVSAGFTFQLIVGFPFWGWLLIRKRAVPHDPIS